MSEPQSHTYLDERRLTLLRKLLAVSAWTMLAVFAVAVLLTFPPLEAAIEARRGTPVVDTAGSMLLVIMGCAAFGLWGSSVLYALLQPRGRQPRAGLVLTLVVTNVFGGLIYYFFFVRGRSPSREQHEQIGTEASPPY